MNTNELTNRVIRCIAKKQERDSWDFKCQWYDKEKGKTSLLHDILCMANLTSDEDGIIIVGVDEENDCNLVDVTNDPNRKDTHEMVKFLRDKPFDGGIRPMVRVEEVIVRDVTLDVIVVENTSYTPFYLTNRFQEVEAYHIYTRVGDSNTPIVKSADRDKVEALWKKRFGIDKPPLERMKIYLRNYKNWVTVDGEQSWYYEFAPEFRIETEIDEGADAYNYYCFTQLNPKPSYYALKLKYHSTVMYDTVAVVLDGGRFMTAVPNMHVFGFVPFYFYTTDSINYALHSFFEKKSYGDYASNYMFDSWNGCVPTLGDKNEAEEFFQWLKEHELPNEISAVDERLLPIIPETLENGEDGKRYKEEYRHAMIIMNLYDMFINQEANI